MAAPLSPLNKVREAFRRAGPAGLAPILVGVVAFAVLFWEPFTTLLRDWWSDPEAGHGLLLGPVSVWLAWRSGIAEDARPARGLGLFLLAGAILLRYMSGLAAELFTMRFSLWLAAAAVIISMYGVRQLVRWWLPASLLFLSIPLPAVLTNTLAFPLQLKASAMGTALLKWRQVPVVLTGNVIHVPGNSLFVTEACSGLRSLTALLALGLLIGGLWLKHPVSRTLLVLLAIPVAMFLNGVRVFLTGFLVYYVSPALGEGLMHYTEGWVIFVVAFVLLGALAWGMIRLENVVRLIPARSGR